MKKHEWEVTYYFEFFDDEIIYKLRRGCDTYENMNIYAQEWIKKFGYRYGKCVKYTIRRLTTFYQK